MKTATAALPGGPDGSRLGSVAFLLLLDHVLAEVARSRHVAVVDVRMDAVARRGKLFLVALLARPKGREASHRGHVVLLFGL